MVKDKLVKLILTLTTIL